MTSQLLAFFLLALLCIGCQSEKKVSKDSLQLSDINLVITSETSIDSVWVADIGQKESLFLSFKDTVKVDLKRDISDLYNVYVHSGGQRKGTQLWLDGENLILDMNFNAKKLTVDNVNLSPLYDASIQHTKTYKELLASGADSTTIDKFLISEIRNHIDTPLSHAIVGDFLFRNQNDRDKVDQVYRMIRMQTDTLKTHFISNIDKMKHILDQEAVQFDQYALGDINDQTTIIALDPSKRYLLDFWFVQCQPCLIDHKRIAKNLGVFEDNAIELIGISRDTKYTSWERYLKKHDYPWVNVREQNPEKRLTYDLSIWEFPTYALIDHTGTIEARFHSFAQFENYINKNK